MTRTKTWRLSLAAILGFGWLFLTPAYSDDPLGTARQQIDQLEADVQKLNDKISTQAKIDIANSKYDAAVAAKANMDSKKVIMETKQSEYDSAVIAQSQALSAKNIAQSAVEGQTVVVATANTNKQNKQDALDVANINLSSAQITLQDASNQGVAFRIYPLSRNGNTAYLSPYAGLMCQGAIGTFYTYAGDGAICYSSQNIIGIFNATLTVPAGINDVYFAAYTDDGSKIYVNGVLEASQWREQGGTWGPYTRHFNTSVNKTLDLEVWWYNGGGPGVMTIGWGYNGIWTGIPSAYLSYGSGATQQQTDAYNAALSAQQAAQNEYDAALATYNTENSTLSQYNQNLTTAEQNLTIANQNLTTANENLTNSTNNYNNSVTAYNTSLTELNDAIIDAQNEYNKQWNEEENQRVQAAIAQALASQPQPTIQPTIAPSVEPSPEPSPEQTKPVDPTPEPSSNTTDEPKPTPTPEPEPTVAPSPEPSPQPTDTVQDPTPEPTVDPSQIPDKTTNTPVDEQTANLIADLTNSNTLTKLSPEQKVAVAQALGIKATEIAKVAEIAKTNEAVGKALEQFGDRANANLNAPMPYTLADATTEVQAEAFLSDPLGAFTNIDLGKVLNPSEWGKDMTDDQREKAQEIVVPVIIASNLVAAAMTRRI